MLVADGGKSPRIIKITVGNRKSDKYKVFYVLDTILCHHSPFFRAALNGSFAEAESGKVDLPEDDPNVFAHLLLWMHGQDYTFKDEYAMTDTLRLLELADKLLVGPALVQHVATFQMTALMKGRQELTAEHIRLAYNIPSARSVARVFAKYSVRKYIQTMGKPANGYVPKSSTLGNFPFSKELEEVHGYATDLISLVVLALRDGYGHEEVQAAAWLGNAIKPTHPDSTRASTTQTAPQQTAATPAPPSILLNSRGVCAHNSPQNSAQPSGLHSNNIGTAKPTASIIAMKLFFRDPVDGRMYGVAL